MNSKIIFIFSCVFLFLLLVINIIILDFKVFKNNSADKNIKTSTISSLEKNVTKNQNSITSDIPVVTQEVSLTGNSCDKSCLETIKDATASIKLLQSEIEELKTSRQVSPAQTQNGTASQAKEFYIPLGVGSNSTDDWADVAGAQAYIDSTLYGQIKTVTFEATMHIPTGNEIAYVRLYNATDKHPVWYSEMSLEGGTTKILISQPITLDSGRKLYQVQMKTSLKYPAILDQSRVHILTN